MEGYGTLPRFLLFLYTPTLIEVLGPVDVIETGHTDAVGGGGVGEELVFEIDAHVRDFTFRHICRARRATS